MTARAKLTHREQRLRRALAELVFALTSAEAHAAARGTECMSREEAYCDVHERFVGAALGRARDALREIRP